jgi:hypothetical protein
MTLNEAKVILSTCKCNEVKEYIPEDTVVHWSNDSFPIAIGFYSNNRSSVCFYSDYEDYIRFTGENARELYRVGAK